MRVAIVSDVHSNAAALRAVLRDVRRAGIPEVWMAGDMFGYYPWAAETFALLTGARFTAVLGNHDLWVLRPEIAPEGITGRLARENSEQLALDCPAALTWLAELRPLRRFTRQGWRVTIAHGTPTDPVEGRCYPDDGDEHDWTPSAGEILVLGQTHYPLVRGEASRGLLLNPGSVGQPRDGDPGPAWAVLDLDTGRAELRRSAYDHRSAMAYLRGIGWDDHAVRALAGSGPRGRLATSV